MKNHAPAAAPDAATAAPPSEPKHPPPPAPPRETPAAAAPPGPLPTVSPAFQHASKTPARRVLRLKCPQCSEYPDGFRSEHELRRHTNRVHRPTRKVWVTIDTSPDKSFLANCKACQTGKRYNECYNAASHLRRMHFHPHKRGERKMTAAEARRGGKPGDLDPPMEVLKSNWLQEVDEVIGDDHDLHSDDTSTVSLPPVAPLPQQLPPLPKVEAKAPPTPTTPSTRSMAIESIVDKVEPS
ncbi:hypothetical protein ACEQ8H_002588 [Pleosporales sp. CAS-2024a]